MNPAVTRALSHLSRYWLASPLPLVGIELREGSVGIVRAVREKGRIVLGGAATVELPKGALSPALSEAGILDGEAVKAALRTAAERSGAAAGGSAVLVLPDAVFRVTTLSEEETGKARGRDLVDLARFRLRRLVPFDVKEARVGVVRSPSNGLPAVAAVAANDVITGFEALIASCGFRAGVVEPSGLALTALLPRDDADRLLVDWDEPNVTLIVARGDWPLVFRTVSGIAAEMDEVAQEIKSTLLFCREKLKGVAPREIVANDPPRLDAIASRLEAALGLPVSRPSLPWLEGAGASSVGLGAAMAAILGRAA